MRDDPVIQRVREARRAISAEHDHDVSKLVAYYVARQERRKHRIRRTPEEATPPERGTTS